MGNRTRKSKEKRSNAKVDKGMTIPELRKAFDHIERFIQSEKGQKLEVFRKEWKKVFGKEVTESAAREYLTFMGSKKPSVQSGGMAPLDYTTRAGADIPYGNFPPYVQSGFGKFNLDSFTAVGGKEDITPIIPAGMGSNCVTRGGGKRITRRKQKGGANLPSLATALSEAFTRPFGMNSPPSTAQVTQMAAKGVDAQADSRPEVPSFSFPSTTQTTFSTGASSQSRVF